mmetsp:Transcript_4730/g.7386  ORF Transcript_4730/g.7386 Transcript_4730/m.7386 type:complete len:89 (+) Transcript_4730:873-1139(+)
MYGKKENTQRRRLTTVKNIIDKHSTLERQKRKGKNDPCPPQKVKLIAGERCSHNILSQVFSSAHQPFRGSSVQVLVFHCRFRFDVQKQ